MQRAGNDRRGSGGSSESASDESIDLGRLAPGSPEPNRRVLTGQERSNSLQEHRIEESHPVNREVRRGPGVAREPPNPRDISEDDINVIKMQKAYNKPRIVLESIVMENFKSYSNTMEFGPFSPGFNGIVGANGAGKSNFLDGLLFLFGYQARRMRQDKIANVISHQMGDQVFKKAFVQAHFAQVRSDYEQLKPHFIPNTQFYLRRTVNSTGASHYSINGEPRNLQQVKTLLKSKGVDLTHHRFLILQGQVEQIANMKPKGNKESHGMLQFLEDVIGSDVNNERIETLEKELLSLTQQLKAKVESLQIVEKGLTGMAQQKNIAIRFVHQQRKFYRLQNMVLQARMSHIEDCSLVAGRGLNVLCKQSQAINQKREFIKPQYVNQQFLGARYAVFRDKTLSLKRQLQRLKEVDKLAKGQQTNLIFSLEKEYQKLKTTELDHKLYDKTIQSIGDMLPRKEQQAQQIEQQIGYTRNQMRKHGVVDIPKQYESNKERIKEIEKILAANGERQKQAVLKVGLMQQRIEQGNLTRIQKEKDLKSALEQEGFFKQALRKISDRISSTTNQMREFASDEERHKAQVSRIQGIFYARNNEQKSVGEKNLIQTRVRKARIPGVIGRLGNLGTCPPEFNDIITSCCPQLDNFVVDRYSTGQKIMDLLRTEKLGRATCLILETVHELSYEMNRSFQCPPGATRLFDVVTPTSDQARLAFYCALRDTLFVPDSNKMNEIAFNTGERKRVVSRGKNNTVLITEKTGVMSSFSMRRGGFGTQTGVFEIDQAQVKNLQSELDRHKSKLAAISDRKRPFEESLSTMKEELKFAQRKMYQLNDQVNICKEFLKEFNASKGPTPSERNLSNAQKALELVKNEARSCLRQLQQLLSENEKTQKYLSQKMGPQVFGMRQKLEHLQGEKSRVDRQIKMMKIKNNNNEKRIQDFRRMAADSQKKINMLTKEFQKFQQERAQNQVKAKAIVRKLTQLANNFKFVYQGEVITQAGRKLERCLQKYNLMTEFIKQDKRDVPMLKPSDVDSQMNKLTNNGKVFIEAYQQLEQSRRSWQVVLEEYTFIDDIEGIERLFSEKVEIAQFENKIDYIEKTLATLKRQNRTKDVSIEDFENSEITKTFSAEEILILKSVLHNLQAQHALQKDKLDRMRAHTGAIHEFLNRYNAYKESKAKVDQIGSTVQALETEMTLLHQARRKAFIQGYNLINLEVKNIYRQLSGGGEIDMGITNTYNPFQKGVAVVVKPPRKTWKDVAKVSGGQKTMSSLAIIFALHAYKPSPFYLMDQMDAALDVKNTEIISKFISKRSISSQFLVVTHRDLMYNRCDALIGVCKQNETSLAYSIKNLNSLSGIEDLTNLSNLDEGNKTETEVYPKEMIEEQAEEEDPVQRSRDPLRLLL